MNSVLRAPAALRSGLWPPKLSLGTSIEQVLARRMARTADRATYFLAQDLHQLQGLPAGALGHNAPVIGRTSALSPALWARFCGIDETVTEHRNPKEDLVKT